MNKQEVFNKVKQHLLTQKSCSSFEGACVYLDKDTGNKCAVGCLIPDEILQSSAFQRFLTLGIEYLLKRCEILPQDTFSILQENYEMLKDLQNVHDSCSVEEWPAKLDEIEKQYFGLLS